MNNNLNQKHIKYIPGFYLSGKYIYIYTQNLNLSHARLLENLRVDLVLE